MAEDKTKELLEKLEKGIQDLYSSEKYITYLKTLSKFHNYSFNNTLLIALQKPSATYVAGFNSWKNSFKRHVNKGEKGIQILAPAPYKTTIEMDKIDPITKKPVLGADGKPVTEMVEVIKPYFKPVYVFDVSQTSGEPLPTIANELKADVENFNQFYKSLEMISPFPMEKENITSGAKGYCDPENKRIAINNGMSEAQTIKTAIHEISHSILHAVNGDKKDSRTREVEAESIAFVVSSHFGIDTSDYSFGYIAGWSSGKELKELKNSLDTIQKTANDLIKNIEAAYQELQLSHRNTLDSVIHDNDIDLDREKDYIKEENTENISLSGISKDEFKKYNNQPLNPEIAPVVTFIWSEHEAIKDNQKMSLFEANNLMKDLDSKVVALKQEAQEKGDYYPYFKTKFQIEYVMNGETHTYTGRQDIGDGDGSLIDHIKDHGEKELPALLKYNAITQDEFNTKTAFYKEITTYLQLHNELESVKDTSSLETAHMQLITNSSVSPELKAEATQHLNYHQALSDYVDKSRHELNYNTGNIKFPEFPQKSDYIKPEPKKTSIKEKMNAAKEKAAKKNISKKEKISKKTKKLEERTVI